MTSPSREHLLGYLLGALERTEHEQVEADLDQNPNLRAELYRVEACLDRLGLDRHPSWLEPPPGLAVRTCRFVALQTGPSVERPAALTPCRSTHSPGRFSWSDLVVAAAALLVAAAIFFPALSYSRFQSQVAACQNQMRLIGLGFHGFSELQPDHSFPGPEASGNRSAAGVVAPLLISHQLVTGSSVFLCPSSQIARQAASFHVPTVDELDRASGATLAALERVMGGDYGYNMGFTRDGQLVRPCNSQRRQYVLVADAPSDLQPGRLSANHRGRGQNMLYEDGHVEFIVQLAGPQLADDPFHNREGRVAAGLDSDDAVLGASADRPLPVTLISNGH
jgi:hypothetical protein